MMTSFGSIFASEIGAQLSSRGLARSRRYGTKDAEFWTEVGTLGRITKVWAQGSKWPDFVKLRLYFATAVDRDTVVGVIHQNSVIPGLQVTTAKTSDQDPRCSCAVDLVLAKAAFDPTFLSNPSAAVDGFKKLLIVAGAA